MYRTLSLGSPWVKMTSARRYSTIFLAIPAEPRNAWTLNVPFLVDSMARPLENIGTDGRGRRRLRWTADCGTGSREVRFHKGPRSWGPWARTRQKRGATPRISSGLRGGPILHRELAKPFTIEKPAVAGPALHNLANTRLLRPAPGDASDQKGEGS